MILKKNAKSLRSLLTVFAMFALAAMVLWSGANNSKIKAASNGDAANSPEATFAGTGVGAIPDTATSGTFGTPLVVSFNVTGVTGNVTDVSLNMTLTHTWNSLFSYFQSRRRDYRYELWRFVELGRNLYVQRYGSNNKYLDSRY
jgi:hypothetical protein